MQSIKQLPVKIGVQNGGHTDLIIRNPITADLQIQFQPDCFINSFIVLYSN